MFPWRSLANQHQTATKRIMVCSGFIGLSFLGIIGFGLLQRRHATENALPARQASVAPAKIRPKFVSSYRKLPLSFERHQSQADTRVRFLARGGGYTIFLTDDDAVLTLRKPSFGMSRSVEFEPPGRRDPLGPIDPRAERWASLAGDLKSLGRSLISDLGQLVPNASVGKRRVVSGSESQPPRVMRMRLVGGNSKGSVVGLDQLPGHSNYFIGNDVRKWRTNLSTYAKVEHRNVYPGVYLVFYGNQGGQLEYDFVVAPHADGNRIAFSIGGLDGRLGVREDANGNLVVPMGEEDVLLHKPRIYQGTSCFPGNSSVDGSMHASCKAIAGGRFVVREPGDFGTQVGFDLPAYDHSQPLIIDPVVSFSTFLGGNLVDGAEGMALDSAGNIYLTGVTSSTDFPQTSTAYQNALAGQADAFVTKLSGDGSRLIYSTYLGGSSGDSAQGIALDSSGYAYLTGETYSADFPLVNPYQSKLPGPGGFVSKLSPDGSALIYSTYLGGNSEGTGNGIAVGSNGEAVVAGRTYSVDFPVVNAFQPTHASDNGHEDAFVTKFSADGSSLIFSTYLGGDSNDSVQGLTLDSSGNIYVDGTTNSSNFPTTPGSYQSAFVPNQGGVSFVSKFSPAGALLHSTYLTGGQAFAIAVSTSGNAFVTGNAGVDFPVTTGAFQTVQGGGYSSDVFVTEFDVTASSLVYSTYLGGNNNDYGNAIVVDSAGNAYVTGSTASLNFPLQAPVQSTMYAPAAFVSELNSAGSQLVFSTYLGGGAGGYGSQQGNAIAVDSSGNIYAAGSTDDPDFPVLNAIQPTLNGAENVFVAKFLNQPSPAISLNPATVSFAPQVVGSASPQQAITLTNMGGAALTVSAIGIEGDFSEINTCSSAIAPQASCTIQVTFTPGGFGTRTGLLSIQSNATLVPDVVQLSGTGQDFMLQGSPGTATVSAGQTATYSLTLSPEGAFAQKVTLSCAGAPQYSTCAVSPTAVTLDGSNSGSATLTVATTGASAMLTAPPTYFAGHPSTSGALHTISIALRWMLLFGALWFMVLLLTKRPKKATVYFLSGLLLVLFLETCGGGRSVGGGGGGSTPKPGTPVGTYTLTVTGATGLNSPTLGHSVIFTLNVN